MSQQILVVEDDPTVRSFVVEYLEANGFIVHAAEDGATMRPIFAKEKLDLIVLDLTLPGEDGLEIARRVRAESSIPIIMVTARSDTIDRVVGLEVGADDYLPKPFEARELLARIRSILRRSKISEKQDSPPEPGEKKNKAVFNDWTLMLSSQKLTSPEGEDIHLTAAEFDLLCALIEHPEHVLSRERLLDLVYGREMSPFERSIDVLIMRLRSKIETDRHKPAMIRTVRGQGYVFSANVEWC